MTDFLIAACSKKKDETKTSCRARDLYKGALINFAFQYAEKHGLPIYILSAKYGVISSEDVIDNYDQKLKRPYDGPWPEGEGVFVGSKSLYFKNVPQRIKPLMSEVYTPGFKLGFQLRRMKQLLAED